MTTLVTIMIFLFVILFPFLVKMNVDYRRELKQGKVDKAAEEEEQRLW